MPPSDQDGPDDVLLDLPLVPGHEAILYVSLRSGRDVVVETVADIERHCLAPCDGFRTGASPMASSAKQLMSKTCPVFFKQKTLSAQNSLSQSHGACFFRSSSRSPGFGRSAHGGHHRGVRRCRQPSWPMATFDAAASATIASLASINHTPNFLDQWNSVLTAVISSCTPRQAASLESRAAEGHGPKLNIFLDGFVSHCSQVQPVNLGTSCVTSSDIPKGSGSLLPGLAAVTVLTETSEGHSGDPQTFAKLMVQLLQASASQLRKEGGSEATADMEGGKLPDSPESQRMLGTLFAEALFDRLQLKQDTVTPGCDSEHWPSVSTAEHLSALLKAEPTLGDLDWPASWPMSEENGSSLWQPCLVALGQSLISSLAFSNTSSTLLSQISQAGALAEVTAKAGEPQCHGGLSLVQVLVQAALAEAALKSGKTNLRDGQGADEIEEELLFLEAAPCPEAIAEEVEEELLPVLETKAVSLDFPNEAIATAVDRIKKRTKMARIREEVELEPPATHRSQRSAVARHTPIKRQPPELQSSPSKASPDAAVQPDDPKPAEAIKDHEGSEQRLSPESDRYALRAREPTLVVIEESDFKKAGPPRFPRPKPITEAPEKLCEIISVYRWRGSKGKVSEPPTPSSTGAQPSTPGRSSWTEQPGAKAFSVRLDASLAAAAESTVQKPCNNKVVHGTEISVISARVEYRERLRWRKLLRQLVRRWWGFAADAALARDAEPDTAAEEKANYEAEAAQVAFKRQRAEDTKVENLLRPWDIMAEGKQADLLLSHLKWVSRDCGSDAAERCLWANGIRPRQFMNPPRAKPKPQRVAQRRQLSKELDRPPSQQAAQTQPTPSMPVQEIYGRPSFVLALPPLPGPISGLGLRKAKRRSATPTELLLSRQPSLGALRAKEAVVVMKSAAATYVVPFDEAADRKRLPRRADSLPLLR